MSPAAARLGTRLTSLMGAALVCLLLGGCQSRSLSVLSMPALPLLAPASLGMSVQATQVIVSQSRRHEASEPLQSTVVLHVTEAQITLVNLTATGQRLYTLTYDGQVVQHSAAFSQVQIPGGHILGLMQLALWPTSTLQAAYHDDWRFDAQAGVRKAYYQGKLMVEIQSTAQLPSAWPATSHIDDYASGMALDVTTLEYQRL